MAHPWKFRILLYALSVILLSCTTRQISQEEIVAFIDDYEKKIEFIERRLAEETWDYATRGMSDSLAFYEELYRRLHADPGRLSSLKSYLTVVDDAALKRKLDLIYRNYMRGVIPADRAIRRLTDSLLAIYGESRIRFEGAFVTADQLREIIRSDPDRERRREACRALAGTDERLTDGLVSLSRMRNQVAARFGYNSFFDFMLVADGLDRPGLEETMSRLDELSGNAYAAALDSLKAALGVEEIRACDVAHALYRSEHRAAAYLPAGGQMKLIEATLMGLGIKLEAMPVYFAEQDVSADVLPGRALPVHVPTDIRVPTLVSDGLPSVRRLFAQVGRAIYFSRIEQDNPLLARPPAPCFEDAMAGMISGLVPLDGWARKYAGMPEPVVRELRMARHLLRLHQLRLMLVHVAFEKELYTNQPGSAGGLYRVLFEKYMMMPADAASIPVDVVMDYIAHPVRYQNELIGDCIRAQTYHYLNERYGSVLDNQRTREFLVQNFCRFGALDDWETLVRRGTGEPLTVSYYLESSDD